MWGTGWVQPALASDVSGEAAEAACALGAAMPLWGIKRGWGWQEQTWATILDRSGDLPRYGTVTVTICRQNGKTTLLYPLVWYWLLTGRRVLFTMHERKLAVEKWAQVADALGGVDRSLRVRRHIGRERIIDRRSGGFFALVTPDDAGGRSETADIIVIDEAAHVSPKFLRAARAATLTRDDAQIIMISSGMTDASEDMATARQRAIDSLGDSQASAAVLEWSASQTPGHDGIDLDDEDVWAQCIPTLGHPGGARIDAVRDARKDLPDEDFAREYLSVASGSPLSPPITSAMWERCHGAETLSRSDLVNRCLGVDVSPDQTRASIVAAGYDRDADCVRAMLLGNYDTDSELAQDVAAAAREFGAMAVLLDERSPAAHVTAHLERRGHAPVVGSAADLTRACASAFSLIRGGKRLRIVPDHVLDVAALGAIRRTIGDYGWAWNRRDGSGLDITSLVALSQAVAWCDAQPR